MRTTLHDLKKSSQYGILRSGRSGDDWSDVSSTGSKIIGAGHYQPPKVLTNSDLADLVDTTDEWIRSRVGIQTRHIAGDEDPVDVMAAKAASAALAAKLGAVNAVIATDVIESGNTSSASVPLAFSKLLAVHAIRPNGPVLLFGFGGGLSYAGQIVSFPEPDPHDGTSRRAPSTEHRSAPSMSAATDGSRRV